MPHNTENITADNEESLHTLIRAITLSQGEFSPILVRCNYTHLREQIIQQLREQCSVPIRELILDTSVTTLYTTIEQSLTDEQPNALMILGLESVENIDRVVVATNQVREEFRKNFSFPIILWVNDEILKKFTRLAPDFDTWTTSVEFAIATDELLNFLQTKAEQILANDSTIPRWLCADVTLENCLEIETACQDLQNRGQVLEPELEANIEFVRGLDQYGTNQLDFALEHYQKSLAFWKQINQLERQGKLMINLARCYYRKAVQHRSESQQHWQESKYYLQQGLDAFEQAQRPDLVAYHISKLCEILRLLRDWEQLKILAQKALELHETYENPSQLAQNYGCLAEVALEQSRWNEASQLAQQALQILSTIPSEPEDEASLYWFIVARSQEQLGQFQEAIVSLEQARKKNNHQYDPQLYIDILKNLRSLYFQQSKYLQAFEVKQEQKSIEAQYGFRPFIGAGSLRPVKRIINPAFDPIDPQERARERMTATGRRSDLNNLIQRLSRNDYKLIVIHGMSGVGKSSLIWAGLEPELQRNPIGDRTALPITLRYYNNWVRELRKHLVKSLREIGIEGLDSRLNSLPPQPPLVRGEQERISSLVRGEQEKTHPLVSSSQEEEMLNQESPPCKGGLGGRVDSTEAIIEQLKNNVERNLLTVLIFDQFEEFFFACTDLPERRQFYEFLKACLNIPYVKIILALREDYLHYLLECDRFASLDVINNNILDKNIRYYLGDFSPQRAKSVILELTERSQFYLEPALLDELVRDLAGELGEVRPIELQVVGAQLQTENITTLEQYHQLGANPKEKLVQRSLEEVIKDCGAENERAARLVLYLLTNENGTRPLKTNDELVADLKVLGFDSETNQLDLVLEVLVGSGLVFLVPDSPANRYQLVHDYLVAFIRQQQAPGLLAELAEAKEKQKLTETQLREALKEKEEALRQEQEERQRAEIAEIEALNSLSQVLWLSHNQLEALLAIVKAGKKLQSIAVQSPYSLKAQIKSQLYQTINQVQERNRFEGHIASITSVSFSPDGQIIAAASDNGMVKLWRIDGIELQTLQGYSNWVSSISFSPNGQIIISAGGDGTVKLWHIDGTEIQTFQRHSDRVNSASFSPDGQMIVSASGDGTVKLWRIDGTEIQTFQRHSNWFNSASFSPDGQMIASASSDGTVKLWRIDGTEVQTFRGHSDRVNSASFSPDGQMIASASSDGTVKLWHIDGTEVQTFRGHSNWVNSLSFSPDGQMIASASSDGTVKLWRIDCTVVQIFEGHSTWVRSVSFSPDGRMIASASSDRTVKLWRIDCTKFQTFQGHSNWVNSVSFSPDGQMIASASSDGTAKLWRIDGTQTQTFEGHSTWLRSVSFSPDRQILASASADHTVKLWRIDGKEIQTLKGHSNWVNSVSFSPNGQMLASASDDGTVKLWRLDGTAIQTFQGHSDRVRSVSFSPDGQILASASADHTVKLWRLDGTAIQTFEGHSNWVTSLSFSPDGQMIASASSDGTVKLWRIDGTQAQTFQEHSGAVYSVCFRPDGQMLASASSDGTVKLWRLDGTAVQTFKGHNSTVYSVAWSPDGQAIASASGDNTVKLWRVEGKEWNLDLDELLIRGCNWLQDYLKTNPNVSQNDRNLCDGICK